MPSKDPKPAPKRTRRTTNQARAFWQRIAAGEAIAPGGELDQFVRGVASVMVSRIFVVGAFPERPSDRAAEALKAVGFYGGVKPHEDADAVIRELLAAGYPRKSIADALDLVVDTPLQGRQLRNRIDHVSKQTRKK